MTQEKVSKETQEKVAELQMMQQRMSVFVAQKQQFQVQLSEVENAVSELDKTKGSAFKLIGELLIEKDAGELKKELEEKKKELDLRLKTLESQEEKSRTKAMELQKELTEKLK